MRIPRTIIVATMLVGLLAVAGHAEQMPAPGETSSQVPALFAFHDVIAPLWHDAWPNKNLAMMRELEPEVEKGVQAIKTAELPGILRDKQEAWTQGVTALAAAATKMKAALAAKEEQQALDAVEELHSRFEQLVRVIRPAMKELDAYHQVLYDIYHKLMPVKDLATLKPATEELVARCASLGAAPVPKRFASKEVELKKSFAALCDATAELKTVATGSDAAAATIAVEKVHTQYQATAALFE
jgi:hypothetical protein